MKVSRKIIISLVIGLLSLLYFPSTVLAAEVKFDPDFYGNIYPDVVAVLGTDPQAMYNHYLTYGITESRLPFPGAIPGQPVDGIGQSSEANQHGIPVPLDQLANRKSLKKKMTDAEFQEAYNVALQVIAPLINVSKEDQLYGVASDLRLRFEQGIMYSMSKEHYNDPYGYFVLGTASCAGAARATGLCLNMLGVSYEHVNENQYSHQWCRVNIDGTYWICDPFGLYVGPEPAPYQHPWIQ